VRRPSLPTPLLGAVALAAATVSPLANPDTFGHLAQGRAVLNALYRTGRLPTADPFTFWEGAPERWVNYEWGSDLLLAFGQLVLGDPGPLLSAMALTALAGGLLVRFAGRRDAYAALMTVGLLLLALPAVRFRLTMRPHLVALPLSAAYLGLLWRPLTARRALAIGALHVLWANLHGSHLLGLGLVLLRGLATLPDDRREGLRLLGLAAALLAASGVTPYGPALLVDALAHALDPAYRDAVGEWQSLFTIGLGAPTLLVGAALSGLLALAPAALKAGVDRRTGWLIAFVLLLAAVRSLRFVLPALVLSAPLFALELRARTRSLPLLGGVVLLGWLALGSLPFDPLGRPLRAGVDMRGLPTGPASLFLGTEARIVAEQRASWFLTYAAPGVRVLVDGRATFYGPEHVQRVQTALERPEVLLPLLQETRPDAVVLQHTAPDQGTAVQTLARTGMALAWLDASFVAFVTPAFARAQGLDPRRFEGLPLGYAPGAILAVEDPEPVRAALDRLGPGPDAQGFAAFVRAMLRLRPLAREAGWAGYRAPASPEEAARVEQAARELAAARHRVDGGVPALDAQLALVNALACHLDEAERHLEEARRERESRETLFAAAEIALRRGDRETVAAFLREARATPEGAADAWVRALATADVSCR
jgi:hypothetical protein